MVQAAPTPTTTTSADHPSPPSRLLSKHRPRRRAAAPRPDLPPPAPTRGHPDLTTCHCCGVRFPPPAPGAKRRPVRPLSSVWRIVLLCSECLSLVRSAAVCSYCLSLDNLPPEDASFTCRSCSRCVHQHCILAEHRTAMFQPIDVENFVCIDCCPTIKPGSKNGGVTSVLKPEASAWETTSPARRKGEAVAVTKLNSLRKAVEAKPASNCAKEAVALSDGGGGSERTGTSDPDLADEEFALQLHLAMNGSPRISRGQGKGQKGLNAERKGIRDHGLCVTNMMDQLDDDETEAEMRSNWSEKPNMMDQLDDDETEAEMRSNWSEKHVVQCDPSVTVVLALECKGSHAKKSRRGKRKNPPETAQYNDLVDRFKNKYSKRNLSAQVDVQSSKSKTMTDGGKVIAPMR